MGIKKNSFFFGDLASLKLVNYTKRLDVKLTCVFDGLKIERKNKDRPVQTPVPFCGCNASSKPSNYIYGFLKNCFQQRLILYETPVS